MKRIYESPEFTVEKLSPVEQIAGLTTSNEYTGSTDNDDFGNIFG